MLDQDLENSARTGHPHTAMLRAKRAVAGTRHNFEGIRLKGKGERDIPAVARTNNQHESGLRYGGTGQSNSRGGQQSAGNLCRMRVVKSVECRTTPGP